MKRAPGLRQLVRPLDLANLPTSIREEPALARIWELEALHVKRDDETSRLYGGSKVRALEYLLARAKANAATRVATWGPWGSHHVLATAIFAREQGLDLRALTFPQPGGPQLRAGDEVLAALGADVSRCASFLSVPGRLALLRLATALAPRGAWIPAGATSPLGILGMVEGALELDAAIEAGDLAPPGAVLVPAGSCGTAAGLLLGLAVAGRPLRLVAVRVAPRPMASARRVRRLARQGLRLLRQSGLKGRVTFGPLEWIDAYAKPGYARPSPEALRVFQTVTEDASFRCETTYTAKALAALQGGLLRGCRVVFWNTFSAVDPPGCADG